MREHDESAPDWSNPALVLVQSAALSGFLSWAAMQPDAWAAFTAETGVPMPRAATGGINRMIDDATGYQEQVMRKFIAWVIPAMWGPIDDVPPDMRALTCPQNKETAR